MYKSVKWLIDNGMMNVGKNNIKIFSKMFGGIENLYYLCTRN